MTGTLSSENIEQSFNQHSFESALKLNRGISSTMNQFVHSSRMFFLVFGQY